MNATGPGTPGSPRPYLPPHPGPNDGPQMFGLQGGRLITAANSGLIVIDAENAKHLWRISITGGQLRCDVTWGTARTRQLLDLRAPLMMCVPGKVTVAVRKAAQGDQECFATLTPVTAGSWSARRSVDATAGAVILHEDSSRFVALVASTLSIDGLAVTLAAAESVPLISPANLLTGYGFEEFEA
jgi:hypothetical protein